MRQSILVVDDNEDLLELVKEALVDARYEVTTASSGPKALDLLGQNYHPNLILLDVKMPGMTGPQFLDRLEAEHREVLSEANVVYSSAGRPPADPRVAGFIDKMTDLREMLRKISLFLKMGPERAA